MSVVVAFVTAVLILVVSTCVMVFLVRRAPIVDHFDEMPSYLNSKAQRPKETSRVAVPRMASRRLRSTDDPRPVFTPHLRESTRSPHHLNLPR
jgi:hypothetical protein